ncbi:hypothetical protein PMAYCL1PPCAC_00807, partial [Pristionchus mayeri]
SYLKEELKEEPLDDYPSMSLGNEKSNQSAVFLKEPKEELLEMEIKDEPIDEHLSNGNQPSGPDFFGDEIKEEEFMNDDLIEPKDEPIDIPLSAVDEKFTVDLLDEFKDQPILNEEMESFENAEVETRKRPPRNASRPAKYIWKNHVETLSHLRRKEDRNQWRRTKRLFLTRRMNDQS